MFNTESFYYLWFKIYTQKEPFTAGLSTKVREFRNRMSPIGKKRNYRIFYDFLWDSSDTSILSRKEKGNFETCCLWSARKLSAFTQLSLLLEKYARWASSLYKIGILPPTLRPRSSTSTASCGRDHITDIITCHLFSPDDNFITSHNFQILLNRKTRAFAVTTTALLELLQLIPEDATLKEDAVLFSKIRDPC